jgi:hypothetical protein
VVVLGATEAVDVLDDRVLVTELNVTVAAGAAVQLPGDPTDQPCLVTLFGDPLEAPSHTWLSVELPHERVTFVRSE